MSETADAGCIRRAHALFVVQRATAIRLELTLTQRAIRTAVSASVVTESLVVAVIAVSLASTTSRPRDACVRRQPFCRLTTVSFGDEKGGEKNEMRLLGRGLIRPLGSRFRTGLLCPSYSES